MTWPNDRKFTDANGQILNHCMGQLDKLKPLLDYSTLDFIDLKALIIASRQDEETDPGAVINLAFPIDTEPLPSEDWLIEYKNSAQAGRRVLISTLLALAQPQTLISTTSFSGSETNVTIPSGYRDVLLRVNGMGFSGNNTPTIGFSEDGGTTLIAHTARIYNDSASYSASPAGAGNFSASSMTSSNLIWGQMTIFDYTNLASKAVNEEAQVFNQFAWSGGRVLTSTQPINLVRYGTSAGTFASGTVELWGIP